MTAVHPDRELAPRDVVARAIWARLAEGRRVFLDATRAVGERFPERFPTVFALCRQHGLDPRVEPLPVVPAAHYHMGGVAVDARGRTSLPGLWACGEVAATGAHGANRLASNSLLEALVFGARVAEDIQSLQDVEAARAVAVTRPELELSAAGSEVLVARLRRVMWERVGVERDEAGLAAAVAELATLSRRPTSELAGTADRVRRPAASPLADHGFGAAEARNLLLAGRLLAQAALARRESRGGHYRVDYPQADPAWQRRLFLTVTAAGTARFEAADEGAPGRGAALMETAEPAPALAAAARLA
jgi:L-aspartate oxidase